MRTQASSWTAVSLLLESHVILGEWGNFRAGWEPMQSRAFPSAFPRPFSWTVASSDFMGRLLESDCGEENVRWSWACLKGRCSRHSFLQKRKWNPRQLERAIEPGLALAPQLGTQFSVVSAECPQNLFSLPGHKLYC